QPHEINESPPRHEGTKRNRIADLFAASSRSSRSWRSSVRSYPPEGREGRKASHQPGSETRHAPNRYSADSRSHGVGSSPPSSCLGVFVVRISRRTNARRTFAVRSQTDIAPSRSKPPRVLFVSWRLGGR